ncbi:MAG: PLP-dependent aminotransferase family protein [Pyrinomonadaceae bacterium]
MKEQIPFIDLRQSESRAPLYRQIYEAVRLAILRGEFASKTRLPSTRELARNLGVSRITVVNAYEQLLAEGYLIGKIGAGTFVAPALPDDLLQTGAEKGERSAAGTNPPAPLSPFGRKLLSGDVQSARVHAGTQFRPFQNGLTAIDLFPFEIWWRIAAKYHKNPPRSILGYGDPRGFYPLRQAVAAHLGSARGVNCSAEQVVITSGAQQALDLTARIFLTENDAVLVEDPCYREACGSFAATGARIVPVEVDEEGLNPAKIPGAGARAKLVYATPSHQYPLGATMNLARRLALLDWAEQNNAWIIEDDYNSEYRYAGRPLASLQGLDKAGRVIYVGTFSKTIFPGLRIGCAVVPPELVDVYGGARALGDVHSAAFDQAVLAEFIAEGHFARHVRRMRLLYEHRQRALVAACEKHLKGRLEVKKAAAGMHLVGWLPEGVDDRRVADKAAEKGIKVSPVSSYSLKKKRRGGLVLGYTAFDERQIEEGVRRLSEAL